MNHPGTTEPERSEAEFLSRLREGDSAAFAELIDQYKGLVLNLVSRMSGRVENADDLAQEVFVRVWKGLPNFRGECRLSTWIYRIALNLSIAEGKSARSRAQFYAVDDPSLNWSAFFEGGSDNPYAEEVVLKERMMKLVAQMPEKHRMAVVLYYLKDLSYVEISEVMEVPVGTVKSYLFRGKAWLRDRLLGKDGNEEDWNE